jgi:two-component system, sensor histidine kinase
MSDATRRNGYLRAILDGALDAVVVADDGRACLEANPAACRLFGLPEEQLVGCHLDAFAEPDMDLEALWRRVLGAGRLTGQWRVVRPDGSRRIAEFRAAAHFVPGRHLLILTDISDRTRTEDALKVAEARYLRAEDERSGILARERATRADAERREREAAELAHIARALSQETQVQPVADRIVDAVSRLLGVHSVALRLLRPDGGLECLAVAGPGAGALHVGHVLPAGQGVGGLCVRERRLVVTTDICADPSIPMSAGSRDLQRRLGNRLVAAAPLVVEGNVIGVLSLGHAESRMLSEREAELLQALADQSGLALRNAQLLERERRARSEAEAARAQAQAASNAKDEFLAMLAHELRNPLSVVVNGMAVLDRIGSQAPAPVRTRELVRRQTDHLTRLLDDLLDVARISQRRITLRADPLDLRAAIDMAVEAQRHRFEVKRQTLAVSLPGEPVPVTGDHARLQQVAGNLLDNACKYTPVGGSIALALSMEADEAVLRVRDDGSGIPPEKLGSVFDLFTQVHSTLARTQGGLGIGLSLVKRLVELHGGTVHASSQGPGTGTEFVVRLPVSGVATVSAPEAPPEARARSIVVIEDNDDVREALVSGLQMHGHRVWEARSGGDGIEVVLRERPEIVLVDIGLPDVDGYAVCERLRNTQGQAVRLVALTGYGQPGDRARSAEAGFDLHLVKPVAPDELLRSLAAL